MNLNLKRIESPFVLKLENESSHTVFIDASEQIGGRNKGFRPMELLAGSLASCASIDVISILQKKRIIVGCYEVQITANRVDAVPSVFESIHLEFVFYNVIDERELDKTIQLALYKYCSVSASLDDKIRITYSIKIKA